MAVEVLKYATVGATPFSAFLMIWVSDLSPKQALNAETITATTALRIATGEIISTKQITSPIIYL